MAVSGNLEARIHIQQPVYFHQERSFDQQEINKTERLKPQPIAVIRQT